MYLKKVLWKEQADKLWRQMKSTGRRESERDTKGGEGNGEEREKQRGGKRQTAENRVRMEKNIADVKKS